MRMPFPLALVTLCILLILPVSAMGAEPALLNGSDGGYWGLSKAEVAAKAPGTAKGEQKMGGFVGLVYADTASGIPVETFYTLKADKCWKVTITAKSRNKDDMLPLFAAVVAELTGILGTPSEVNELENISRSAGWPEGKTTASVYCSLSGDMVTLDVAYESKALSEAIWGKRTK